MKGKRHGFTLIELVVVMVLLAVVLAVGIPRYAELRQKQFLPADLRTVELLQQAEMTYFLLNQQHTFDTGEEQNTETFTASMVELSSLVDFQSLEVFEDPYWHEQDDRWIIRYAEGDGYSFEAQAGNEDPSGDPEDPEDSGDDEDAYSEWDPDGDGYKKGDIVTYNGETYQAKKDVKAGGKPPKNGKDWKKK